MRLAVSYRLPYQNVCVTVKKLSRASFGGIKMQGGKCSL